MSNPIYDIQGSNYNNSNLIAISSRNHPVLLIIIIFYVNLKFLIIEKIMLFNFDENNEYN